MSEMVEKVARAICRASGEDPYAWDSIARAAIEAMREPSEAMVAVCFSDGDAGPIWRDMINAALAEPA